VQLLRSSLRLAARAARVERPSASFGALPASLAGVANFTQSSLLLRQVLRVFSLFFQVQAPLALRLLTRRSPGALPVNKAFKTDALATRLSRAASPFLHAKAATLLRRLTCR
jgi:hypothetical protein